MSEVLKPIAPESEQSAKVSENVAVTSGDESNNQNESVETNGNEANTALESSDAKSENSAKDAPVDVAAPSVDSAEKPEPAPVNESPAAASEPSLSVDKVIDYANKGLKELVDMFQELLDRNDMQLLYKHAEGIKAAFYKTLRKEKIESGFIEPAADHIVKPVDVVETEEIVEEPEESKEVNDESEVISVNPFAEIERGFKELFSKYKADRSVYTQELEKQKEENYKEKSLLLEKLKAIVEDQEDLSRIYPAFKEIQTKWRAIGPVPQAKAKDLYENYRHYAEKFYDYVKINREFRDLDFRKNLEAKEQLCERAEALENDENVVESFRLLQKLHEEWKEIGPVSREQREAIWGRFKLATANINKKHQGYFESQKGDQKENLEKKTALCEKVEEIAAKEIKDSNAWNTLSKNIEEIQNEWKKIGFASKKENQKIYDRFRAACDKFYSLKREFYSAFKDQMQENMEKKVALCEQAEALKESEEWKKTADMLINIQKQWKEIGPVSRKKSEQIWKRFRAACDAFFDNREKHFGEQDNQYEDNLSKKQSLVEEIKAFVPSAEKNENIESLKGFQSRWNEIGFVPFKEKEKIQTAYNQAIEEKFGDIRPDDGGDRVARYKRRYGDNNRNRNTGTHSERERLIQKYSKMEQDIATWENNMGFFSKSKNAEAMLEDMKKKVDQAKEELAELEQKIHSLDNQNEE